MNPDDVNPAAQSLVITLDHMYCNVMSADSVVTPCENVSVDFIVENSRDSFGSVEIPIMSQSCFCGFRYLAEVWR